MGKDYIRNALLLFSNRIHENTFSFSNNITLHLFSFPFICFFFYYYFLVFSMKFNTFGRNEVDHTSLVMKVDYNSNFFKRGEMD